MADKFRMIGTTDDVVDCSRCGKPDLRMTVVLEFLDDDGQPSGEVTYYGSTCASKALAERGVKVTPANVRSKAEFAQRQRILNARHSTEHLAHYGIGLDEVMTPERIEAVLPAWRAANKTLSGLRPVDEARRLMVECIARHQNLAKM